MLDISEKEEEKGESIMKHTQKLCVCMCVSLFYVRVRVCDFVSVFVCAKTYQKAVFFILCFLCLFHSRIKIL